MYKLRIKIFLCVNINGDEQKNVVTAKSAKPRVLILNQISYPYRGHLMQRHGTVTRFWQRNVIWNKKYFALLKQCWYKS